MKIIKALLGIAIFAALVLTAALAYYHSKQKEIDVTRTVVVYTEGDPSSAFTTQIHIAGTIKRPLFRQHKFEGSVQIDAFEFTRTYETLLAISVRRNGIYAGGLQYFKLGHGRILTAGGGMIWFDENFERINIWTSPSWGKSETPEPDMFIVTGETYEQVIANQKAIKEKFNDDDLFMPKSFP